MGYCISQREADFEISKENVPKALEAIRKMADNTSMGGGMSSGPKGTVRHFSWVSTDVLKNAKDIKDAFGEWRWDADIDEKTGAVTSIQFEGEKSGDDEQLLQAIASFVKDGSYIEMQGEEGEIWRWRFDGKVMYEDYAALDWDDNAGIVEKILKAKKKELPTLLGIHPGLDKKIEAKLKGK